MVNFQDEAILLVVSEACWKSKEVTAHCQGACCGHYESEVSYKNICFYLR
jgi:hypothetical protein